MTRHKLALLAVSLAGGAVLIGAVVATLRDGPVDPRSTDEALADSPIARLVARMSPPDSAAHAEGWAAGAAGAAGTRGWEAWSRAAGDLRARGDMTGNSDGELGFLRGRSFWDGEPDLDGASGRSRRLPGITAARTGSPAERNLRGRPYRVPRTGRPTILTSGHRIDPPRLSLPDTPSVGMALGARSGVPVRVEVCVNQSGRPAEARVIEGTGVAAVDRYVASRMLVGRYRPLWRDGRRVEFCERSTIVLRKLEAITVVRPPAECGPDC